MTFERVAPDDSSLGRLIEIYLSAFPREERRELSSIYNLLRTEECYHLVAIRLQGEVIGMLAYWDLDTIIYIEYFAMDALLRGGGLGSKALVQMIEHIGARKVLFEVELPRDEIAARRIAFYERYHFKLWENIPYQQPPYRDSDSWLPMLLMTNGSEPTSQEILLLHRKVYQIDRRTTR